MVDKKSIKQETKNDSKESIRKYMQLKTDQQVMFDSDDEEKNL